MHLSKALILGQGISLAAAASCAADNCARAVSGTNKGPAFQSTARSDCSSFFQVTIVPPTVTNTAYQTIFPSTTTKTITTLLVSETATIYPVTDNELTTITTNSRTIVSTIVATVTITTTQSNTALQQRRQVVTPSPSSSTLSATKVPAYASPCSGTVRYSSACSCFGISKGTIVLATPTVSTVITVTGVATQTQNVAFTTTQTLSFTTTVFSSVADMITVTSTSTSFATSVVTTSAGCVPSVPAGNILTNGGFNDGTFNGWNPGGYSAVAGGFTYSISDDAQCGAYGSRYTISAASSYARIGQRFTNTIDASKSYQITTYAKFVSGNGANCFYYLSCQQPGSFSSAGNPRLDTPLSSIPTDWTKYSLNCPPAVNSLVMSLTIQCNQGSGPVTIGLDEIYMFPIS